MTGSFDSSIDVVTLTQALVREGAMSGAEGGVVRIVRDAMQAGAWGCFSADDSPEMLLSMLTSVASGRASYPFVDFSLLKDDPFEQLTRREREVLDALSQGWSNTQISARLGISENTVKYHLKLIYGKLGVANRATAIAQFMQRANA